MNQFDVVSAFSQVLSCLSEKESFVVSSRIGLVGVKKTLQEIGDEYGITRERVRQIEDASIKHIAQIIRTSPLLALQEAARVLVQEAGGIITRDDLVARLVSTLRLEPSLNMGMLDVVLQSDFDLAKSKPQLKTRSYFYFPEISRKCIEAVRKEAYKILKKKGDIIEKDVLYSGILIALAPQWKNLSARLIDAILNVYYDFVKGEERFVGLAEWHILNPKTLHDKSIYILRKAQEPLHFVDITNRISETFSEPVKVNTVHNELIRSEDFVLIGRGIYALKIWGYKSGTVLDVIGDIFRKNGNEPLSTDEIIARVLKVRKVKSNTVYMNLQNKKIQRVGRNLYKMRML